MSRADKLTLWAIGFFVVASLGIPEAVKGDYWWLLIPFVLGWVFTGWSFKVAIRGH